MVEIEKVLDAIKDKPLTVKEIARKLNCSEDAVRNVIIFVNARRMHKIYQSVSKDGSTCEYTTCKVGASEP